VSELSEIARIATVVDNSNKRQWKHRNIYLINLHQKLLKYINKTFQFSYFPAAQRMLHTHNFNDLVVFPFASIVKLVFIASLVSIA